MASSSSRTPGLLSLAWPIFVDQGLRVLIGTVDTLMVSSLGDDAVAGLGVAGQVITLFIILYSFVGIGCSVVITHHLGAGDRVGADSIARTAVAANTWLGVVTSIAIGLLATPALRLMNLPEGPTAYALPFLSLMGGTLFLESMNISIGAVLRAHTHTKDAMLVSVGQNILNAAVAAILLFGLFGMPKLGVVGVACASVLSRLCACVALWIILKKRTGMGFRLRDQFAMPIPNLRRILEIGIPAAGENISWFLAYMTVTSFIATMGAASLATQSYTMSLVSWVIILNVAVGLGTEIMIGHLIGAGRYEEAYHALLKSVRMGFLIALGAMSIMALGAPWLLKLFTNDTSIIAASLLLLRMGLILEPGRSFNIIVISSLRATGDARFPVLMGMVSMWGVWVPLSWLLGLKLGWGMPGVWVAMICDEWLRGTLMHRRWKQRKWMAHAERSRASIGQHRQEPAPASI